MQGIIDYLRPATSKEASKRTHQGAAFMSFATMSAIGLLAYRRWAPQLRQVCKEVGPLKLRDQSWDAKFGFALYGVGGLVTICGFEYIALKMTERGKGALGGVVGGLVPFLYGISIHAWKTGIVNEIEFAPDRFLKELAGNFLLLYPHPGKISVGLLATSVVTFGGGLFWYATGKWMTPQSEFKKAIRA